MAFDSKKLEALCLDDKKKAEAIDMVMEYWDTAFHEGRFQEFFTYIENLDLKPLNPSVIVCIHTMCNAVKDKYDFGHFSDLVKIEYARRGFPFERITGLTKGLP